jgi:hypothetical protein
MPLIDYDSEDDNDEENDDHQRLIDEWGWKPGEVPRFWNPSKLLNEVLLPHKNSLEHLGLTIALKDTTSLIEKSDLVLHFRDFTSLKYLEFDTRILRTRKGNHDQIPPEGIPESLAKILPTSIEVVHILAYHSQFQILHAMLRSLPRQKIHFPNLWLITIVLNGGANFLNLPPAIESEKRLKPLQHELKSLGVDLIFETDQFFYDRPKAKAGEYWQ